MISINVILFAPANCGGVIAVGASTRQGDRASYANYGRRVDISAPGGTGINPTGFFRSATMAGADRATRRYAIGIGTSFAAPYVAGVASLMLARNANLTPGQVLGILSGTARAFGPGTTCANAPVCGAGLLDAAFALQSTIAGPDTAPLGTVAVIEYYRADRDHYFMTADPAEIAFVDILFERLFQAHRRGLFAWVNPALAPANAQPVCRFYSPLVLIDSHFYTASASECLFVQVHWPGCGCLRIPRRSMCCCRTRSATARQVRCRSTASSTIARMPTIAIPSTCRCVAR